MQSLSDMLKEGTMGTFTTNEQKKYLVELYRATVEKLAIHPDDEKLFPTPGNVNQVRNACTFLSLCANEIEASILKD